MKKVLIIAEAGVNHNSDIQLAKDLIDCASESGADIVKFQSFKADNLVSRNAPKARYQESLTPSHESHFDMIKRLELSEDSQFILQDYCKKKSIEYLSSPFDLDSAKFLGEKLGMRTFKIPSGEITNGPLLMWIAQQEFEIILSTGMCSLEDIEKALGIISFGFSKDDRLPTTSSIASAYRNPEVREILRNKVSLLHCTTEYPAPFRDINLSAMKTLKQAFQVDVGYSDHTLGIHAPIAAVAMGAQIIEKHFTISRNLPGPDHKASLEPDELAAMIRQIRDIEVAIGDGVKSPSPSEERNIAIARKSLVTKCAVRKGELFTEKNLGSRRPATGLSPLLYWDFLGKPAARDYEPDERLI